MANLETIKDECAPWPDEEFEKDALECLPKLLAMAEEAWAEAITPDHLKSQA